MSNRWYAVAQEQKAEIECLSVEIGRAHEAMQEFVDRCDAGEVLSKYTYAKFKRILDPAQGGRAPAEPGKTDG